MNSNISKKESLWAFAALYNTNDPMQERMLEESGKLYHEQETEREYQNLLENRINT